MALKFLNKKGWHTESLRNIENVWKEQAGLIPRQERLEFLYDSGLAVGKGSSSSATGGSGGGGFKALEESLPTSKPTDGSAKQMALIHKSVEKKSKEKSSDRKECHKKHHHSGSKHRKHSSSKQKLYSEDNASEDDKISKNHHHKRSEYGSHSRRRESDSKDELKSIERLEKNHRTQKYGYYDEDAVKRNHDKSNHDKYTSQATHGIDAHKNQDKDGRSYYDNRTAAPQDDKRRKGTSKLSEKERAARLREMQEDAEVHKEKRWKRLKKADENDAREAKMASMSVGKNSLDYARTHLANDAKDYVHIHIQLRNDRKSLTTVQMLKKEFIYSKILKIPPPIVTYFLSSVPF
ncbi:hypothetical protein PTKIN_Ptkin10aG0060900 [Pterospermum kingtungense]